MNLTSHKQQAHHWAVEAIALTGFDDSNVSGGHNHHALFGGFFVSVALCAQLVGRVWEASACRFPFTPVRQPILDSPFLFDDEKGEYINKNGAITMANQQEKTARQTQQQRMHALLQAHSDQSIALIGVSDALESLRLRIGFISTGVAQSSDWIDEHAGAELCETVNCIYSDMDRVIIQMDAARKAVQA